MISTIFLQQSVAYFAKLNIGIATVNALLTLIFLIIGFIHYKRFNEKNRYLTFLQFRDLLKENKENI